MGSLPSSSRLDELLQARDPTGRRAQSAQRLPLSCLRATSGSATLTQTVYLPQPRPFLTSKKYEIPAARGSHGFVRRGNARSCEYTTFHNSKPPEFRIFNLTRPPLNRLQPSFQVPTSSGSAASTTTSRMTSTSPSWYLSSSSSEHQCEGLLEGWATSTGRHGIWSSYESFLFTVDLMINQHAKWLEATVRHIASFRLSTWSFPATAWRQDHNGFSHQDPGFVDIMLNKSFNNDRINIYFPADANFLCLARSATPPQIRHQRNLFAGNSLF